MKKTVTVNISSIIFHIDEDAYEKLLDYIDEIRGYLGSTEGIEEIIEDVEARIAEMLQVKITDSKQVITIEDVNEVILQMGEPSQFGTETEPTTKNKRERNSTAKRFYRDPDNKVIGGVCSGIGNYFNIDTLWIRIIFAAALLFFGSGVLLYIFLWVITPEARTTAEKLEMRGEKVNIYNIEKSVKKEFNQIKNRFSKNKKKENSDLTRDRNTENIFERIIHIFITILKISLRIFIIFFGIVLIFIGIFLLIGFLGSFIKGGEVISLTNIGATNISLSAFLKLVIDSPGQVTVLIIGLFLLIGVPLIMIIYNGIKMIFGFKSRFKVIGISAFSLWFTGLILCFFISIRVVNEFSSKVVVPRKYNITQHNNKPLYIDIKSNDSIENYLEYNSDILTKNWFLMKLDGQKSSFGIPNIRIVTSETDSIKLIIYSEARGRNTKEASINADNIKYDFIQTDSSLVLDPFFTVNNYEKWRLQMVRVLIKIPEGKKVVINKRLYYYFNNNINDMNYDLYGKRLIMLNGDFKEEQVKPINDTIKNK